MSAREYGATLALAVGLLLPAVAQAIPIPAERPLTCPSPSLEQVVTEVGPADRFTFTGDSLRPFFGLWVRGRHGPMTAEPDAVTVIARPEQPLVVVYSLGGCALALIEASRPEVFDALRAGIGPVVSMPLPGEPA